MKRFIVLVMILLMSVPSLASCKKETTYDPVPSTEEESRVVMTFTYGSKTYSVKYELYRALFLNLKDDVSGGDDSVWESDNKQEYIDRINTLIASRAAHIYGVFKVASDLGIDLYSDSVDDTIQEYIKDSVEGSDSLEGYGSYNAYLAALIP